MTRRIILLGAGNMGYAMLDGWLRQDPMLEVHVVEPVATLRGRADALGATTVPTLSDLPEGIQPDLVVLVVKPQMVAPILAKCGKFAGGHTTFLSVAAGITLGSMRAALPEAAPIIRCMPNTPAAIGEGMIVLCAGADVPSAARRFVQVLMASSGAVSWITDEAQMDAVTAISGSGPAYVFHFIEVLAEAGQSLGLPADTAAILAVQTIAGAGRMAVMSDASPSALRAQVTSPNGTTAAALAVLMQGQALKQLVERAALAAYARSIELGQES
ncbi:pyrroline-5-carboxylate reductase (plasmid) [Pseudosulfitobacter pseudonitzschiae]|uniref:Pyrroline-5-carboxylate reductase n=1 Tax=Pseudosulfitobacter pseudonitzschiae TaxID=1402135 RepID=A0A221K9H2_9RHOB|nr:MULTISPECIES: pyrroline-5-carboxylate reductase [Roseobacteraceae]ASM75510.1 pyrroline-5-carboxylate reductase [Pseudosulfitobacter pseudonitzschiae]